MWRAVAKYRRRARRRRIFSLETGGCLQGRRELAAERQVIAALQPAMARGAKRHLVETLEGLAGQLACGAAASASELVSLVRQTPADSPIDGSALFQNAAYRALIWWVRAQPKTEHHFHLSGNVDPALVGAVPEEGEAASGTPAFAEVKQRIDAGMQAPGAFLGRVRHALGNAFADGCTHVELRFNPFEKPYARDEAAILERLHAVLGRLEDAAAGAWSRPHAVRLVFSINRRYGAAFARRAVQSIERILRRAGQGLRRRMHGLDLSGPESRDGPPAAWKEAFRHAADLGLACVAHLGDATNAHFPSAAAHLDYVEATLEELDCLERIGHAMVLSPLVERPGGAVEDAAGLQPRMVRVLREIAQRGIAIETAPSPAVLGAHRQRHRVFFWRQLGLPLKLLPIADEVYHHRITLSKWLVDLLLFGPEGPHALTWADVRDALRPRPAFLAAES